MKLNPKIQELINLSTERVELNIRGDDTIDTEMVFNKEKFAELLIKECLDKIETYRIPCGNSPAGEMACEWTYDALKSIRDDIKETFGIEE